MDKRALIGIVPVTFHPATSEWTAKGKTDHAVTFKNFEEVVAYLKGRQA